MRHSLSPLRGLHPNRLTPTAHTVGCTLPPLRGCTRGKHNEKALTHFRLASEPTFDHDCYGVSKAVTDVTKRKSTFQIGNRHRLIWAYNSASFAVKRSAERRIAIVSFASFLSPFWGSHLKSTLTHGLRRGLRSVAPSELSGRDTHSMGTYPAPTGQKSTAHGVSRGSRTLTHTQPRRARKKLNRLSTPRGLRPNQNNKRPPGSNFLLHKTSLLCYKQCTERVWLAGRSICISRVRPASNVLRD